MILLNDHEVQIKQFPNGETLLERDQLRLTGGDIWSQHDRLTLRYESDKDLLALFLIRKYLFQTYKEKGVDLEIPYFPYSRMDRASDSHVFTLKYICDFINNLFFDKVMLYEPHSDVTPALLNNCTWYEIIPSLLKKTDFRITKDYVLYPDLTAHKRYADNVKSSKSMMASKKRNFKTGKIQSLNIFNDHALDTEMLTDMLEHKNPRVFIIDDLCSKGGTFMLAANELKGMGFENINLVVAHCEETIFKGEILKTDLISNVYTTDTIIRDNQKVEKLHIFPYNRL